MSPYKTDRFLAIKKYIEAAAGTGEMNPVKWTR